jgi:hypothetical protein
MRQALYLHQILRTSEADSWRSLAGFGGNLLRVAALVWVFAIPGWAQSVSFSSQTPLSGEVGADFVVLFPLFNSGSADAEKVQITSVTLGHATPVNPSLPLSAGTMTAGDHKVLDFQFAATGLTVGGKYLLTIRGTYQQGTQTLGFSINRFLAVTIPGSSDLNRLQHWMALDALVNFANSLPGVDPAADNQTILNFIKSRPEFVDSDIDPPSSSLWATFADGEKLIVVNDRRTLSSSAAATEMGIAKSARIKAKQGIFRGALPNADSASVVPSQFSQLPLSSVASTRNAMSLSLYGAEEEKTDIAKMLEAQNYTVPTLDASVDVILAPNLVEPQGALVGSLWHAGGDGVFYLASHGGYSNRFDTEGPRDYAVWTITKADFPTDQLLPPGVLNADLIHMIAPAGIDPFTKQRYNEVHYGFTAKFVTDYFQQFSPSSFVFIDACSSADGRVSTLGQDATAFRNAFFNKGATVYGGWTANVDDGIAAPSGRLVFDRLLGANMFFLEFLETSSGKLYKNQRPFNWQSVLDDLPQHSITAELAGTIATIPLGKDPVSGAELTFAINPNTTPTAVFGLLAPSIEKLSITEDELGGIAPSERGIFVLHGLFGTNPGMTGGGIFVGGSNPDTGKTATVGGVELVGCDWMPFSDMLNDVDADRIACGDLPPSGNGSSGNVQVSVRGHSSNIARVTYWQGQFTSTDNDGGSLKQVINFNPAFRVDLREYRPLIHEPPVDPATPSPPPLSSVPYSVYGIFPVSTANFACSGADVVPLADETDTYTWTGGQSLQLGLNSSGSLLVNGILKSKGSLMLDMGVGSSACNFTLQRVFIDGTVENTSGSLGPCQPGGAPTLTLNLGSATIAKGTMQLGVGCLFGKANLTWPDIAPLANTAPDPDSAR